MYADITQSLNAKASAKTLSMPEAKQAGGAKPVVAAGGKVLPENAEAQASSETKVAAKEIDLTEMVAQLNATLQHLRRELHFSVDDDTGRTVIKVINSETDEIIRQIPSEEILRLARNIEDGGGFLVDAKA